MERFRRRCFQIDNLILGYEANAGEQETKVFRQTEDEASETETPPPPLNDPASLITLESCKFYSGGGVGGVCLLCPNPQAGFVPKRQADTAQRSACKDLLL